MERNTGTESNDALIEAYIGPYNKSYYLRAFGRIRGGGQATWHWPALFATSAWLLYRKMWLYAFVYIVLLPVVHLILTSLVAMAAGDTISGWFWFSTYFAIAFLLAPLLANRFYYRHVTTKVAALGTTGTTHEQQMALAADKGGTSVWALVGVGALGVPLVGIVAAVAIPAYQDYTIRAQIASGLTLAGGARAAVEESYRRSGDLPADNVSAGLPPATSLSGTYVASIEVYSGDVYVFYGNDAHALIADMAVVLSPRIDGQDNLSWSCGSRDIHNKHLPSFCRE